MEAFLSKLEVSESERIAVRNVLTKVSLDPTWQNELIYNSTELDMVHNMLQRNDYLEIRRVIKRVSQRCGDLIKKCAWNKQEVLCDDIFEESFTTKGRCCSFNYMNDKPPISTLYNPYHGLGSGLQVILRPEDNKNNIQGVVVIIHRSQDFPGAHENKKNYLSKGSVNYMQVDGSKQECSEEVKALPISHRQCLYSEEKRLEYFNKYTDSNCMSSCEAMVNYELCNCVPYHFDFVKDKPICDIRKLSCYQQAKNISTTSCGCLPQCEDDIYDVTMTSAKFSNDPDVCKMDFLQNVTGTDQLILLNVFFSSNCQTIWIRDTMTSSTYLISSFGGIYSLFLGCSIISIIEILYYLIVRCALNSTCKKGKEKGNAKFKCHVYTTSKDLKYQDEYKSTPILPFVN